MVVVIAITVAAIATGHGLDILVLYYLPCRLAVLWLAFAFDYLPHNGLHHKPTEDKFKTTRNRVGAERLLSPTLLYQNYHLVHHLHPVVPFYRYLKVWRRSEEQYLERDPALSTVGGRPLTADEYRQLRSSWSTTTETTAPAPLRMLTRSAAATRAASAGHPAQMATSRIARWPGRTTSGRG